MLPERLDQIAATGDCDPHEARKMASMLLRATARSTDGPTSHKAASSVTRMTRKRQDVMATFRRFGSLTDEQLVQVYGTMDDVTDQSESGLRTRRSELVRMELLQDTGTKRRIRSGRQAVVWGVVTQ
jgi:hypothetical protein